MNLLILSNNPSRASFRQRIGVYLDTLRSNGINPEVAKLPAGSLARRKLFRRAAECDGVLLHKKGLNLFDATWLARYTKKLIYDFDDAIMYSPKAPDRNSLSRFRPFRRSVKIADMVIAGNSYLAEHARRFNPNVEVLPTGLDTNAYRVKDNLKKDGKIRLVWIGSHSTLRYLAEIKPALEEIGSRFDSVVLRIICDDSIDLRNMPVEKRLWSEEAQAIDLATCDIGLAPLPDNRFTRGKCGFKVLQYAAAALPAVASPVGVNAEYVSDRVTGFHATNIVQWVDGVGKLVTDQSLRKRMGEAAKANVHKFDLAVIARRLVNLVKESLGKSGA